MLSADRLRREALFDEGALAFFEIDVSRSLSLLFKADPFGSMLHRMQTQGGEETDLDFPDALLGEAKVITSNRAAAELLGYDADRTGVPLFAIWTDVGRATIKDLLWTALRPGAKLTVPCTLRAADGSRVSGVFAVRTASPAVGKHRLLLQFLDTSCIDKSAAVDEDRPFGSVSFRDLPVAVCRVSGDQLSLYYSRLGLSSADDLTAYMNANPGALEDAGEICIIEEANPEAARMFGASSPGELVGKAVGFAWRARPDSFLKTLEAGFSRKNIECDTQISRLDGRSVRVLLRGAMIRENGRRLSLVSFVDMTERPVVGMKYRQQREIVRSTRASALEDVSNAVVHEFSQPLAAIATTSITGRRSILSDDASLDTARTSFEQIERYVARASRFIDRLREFASARSFELQEVSLSRIVLSVTNQLAEQARDAGVRVSSRCVGGNDFVLVDRLQIEQVVRELVSDAIDACGVAADADRNVDIQIEAQADRIECTVATVVGGGSIDRADQGGRDVHPFRPVQSDHAFMVIDAIIRRHHGAVEQLKVSGNGRTIIRFGLPLAKDTNA